MPNTQIAGNPPGFPPLKGLIHRGEIAVQPRDLRYIDIPRGFFKRCGMSVVDDAEITARLNALLSPVAFWRAVPIWRASRLGTIANTHLMPMAQLIDERADAVHWKAARKFTTVFKEMLDVVYSLRDTPRVSHCYVPVRSAMHLMFGLDQAHRSYVAMRDEWFGGNDMKALHALVDHYDDLRAPFVFSENRRYGYFLRLVHSDEPLRMLGRASMYVRQATGCGNTEAARRLVKSMAEMQGYMEDPIVEHARLSLLRGGINLVRRHIFEERAQVYSPKKLDQFDFEVKILCRRLRTVLCE